MCLIFILIIIITVDVLLLITMITLYSLSLHTCHSLVEPVEGEGHLIRSAQNRKFPGRVVTAVGTIASSNAHVDLHIR